FVEHKLLYKQKGEVPEGEFVLPLGESEIKREGRDVTVVATSIMVPRALKAADELSKAGIEIEVIDPRTLSPLDTAPIEASIKKTGHVLVVHEAVKSGGIGAEIAARIAEGPAFDYLDAQVARLGGAFTPIPYGEGREPVADGVRGHGSTDPFRRQRQQQGKDHGNRHAEDGQGDEGGDRKGTEPEPECSQHRHHHTDIQQPGRRGPIAKQSKTDSANC